MCILLKWDYAKFGVSGLFLSKTNEEKPFGVRLDPLGKGRVKYECFFCERQIADMNLFTELI